MTFIGLMSEMMVTGQSVVSNSPVLAQERLQLQWSDLLMLTQEYTVSKLGDTEQGSNYQRMLNDLRVDRALSDGTVLLGMYGAPASKNRHHDIEGGLVKHLLQMWTIWNGLRDTLKLHSATHPQINDSNVWRAILHHDLNKVWRYKLVNKEPWTVDYANEKDPMDALLGSTHKSLHILAKYNIRVPLPLHNALICAEGGFSETRPHAETALAKLVYVLDELSANVVDRLQNERFWDSKANGITSVSNGY